MSSDLTANSTRAPWSEDVRLKVVILGLGQRSEVLQQARQLTATIETLADVVLTDFSGETSLVEVDRPQRYRIEKGNRFTFTIKPWGVKTFRVVCDPALPVPSISAVKPTASADMKVGLAWICDDSRERTSHFNIYRDTDPECEPVLLNLVGQAVTNQYTDRPRLNHGGWIRNRLEPDTTYYYRVVPVDRWNNPGTPVW